MKQISPRWQRMSGGDYRILESITTETYVTGYSVDTWFCHLHFDGTLVVKAHFIADGVTGGLDTANALVPSFVHDCLTSLIEMEQLPPHVKDDVDKTYFSHLADWEVAPLRVTMHRIGLKFSWIKIVWHFCKKGENWKSLLDKVRELWK